MVIQTPARSALFMNIVLRESYRPERKCSEEGSQEKVSGESGCRNNSAILPSMIREAGDITFAKHLKAHDRRERPGIYEFANVRTYV